MCGPDGVGLEHHAEAAPVGRDEDAFREEYTTRPATLIFAQARALQARDRPQGRGLSAAAGAEQREKLSFGHLEADVLRRLHDLPAIVRVFGEEAFDFQHAVLRFIP